MTATVFYVRSLQQEYKAIDLNELANNQSCIYRELYSDGFASLYSQLSRFKRQDLLNVMIVLNIEVDDLVGTKRLSQALGLVLQYPEIYWVFMSKGSDERLNSIPLIVKQFHLYQVPEQSSNTEGAKDFLEQCVKRLGNGFSPLFDPTGLRSWARAYSFEDKKSFPSLIVGASVEDETDYAVLNAYAMYKRGISTYVINSKGAMDELQILLNHGDIELLNFCIEDMELNFADVEAHSFHKYYSTTITELKRQGQSRLINRAPVENQIIISGNLNLNEPQAISKPYKGLYDKRLTGILPSLPATTGEEPADDSRHGLPGLNQQVAAALIDACRQMLHCGSPSSHGTLHAIHAAVLALDAKRILGTNTRTLNLTAIEMLQVAEVTAEANFIGVSTKDELPIRLNALEADVKSLWTSDIVSKEINKQVNLSLIKIYESLNQIYTHYGKYDEYKLLSEFIFKKRVELNYPRLSYSSHGFTGSVLEYFADATRNGKSLVGWSFTWITVFCLIYFYCVVIDIKPENISILEALAQSAIQSASLFFTLSLPPALENLESSKGLFAMTLHLLNALVGAVHIGLGVTFLFSQLMRK